MIFDQFASESYMYCIFTGGGGDSASVQTLCMSVRLSREMPSAPLDFKIRTYKTTDPSFVNIWIETLSPSCTMESQSSWPPTGSSQRLVGLQAPIKDDSPLTIGSQLSLYPKRQTTVDDKNIHHTMCTIQSIHLYYRCGCMKSCTITTTPLRRNREGA